MPATTTNLALPYPTGTDTPDVPRDMQALAARLDTALTPVPNPSLPTSLQTGCGLPPGLDCNLAVASGWYWVDASVANTPVANFNGYLQVYTAAWNNNYATQIAIEGAGGGPTWHRFRLGSTWGAWTPGTGGDATWTQMALTAGSQYGSPYGPVQYRKLSSGEVICRGLMTAPGSSTQIFQFPAGYRPGAAQRPGGSDFIFWTAMGAGAPAGMETFRLDASGNLRTGNTGATWVSLDGVRFYAEA